MARLPIPGSDVGVWGNVLNDFLSVELNADGTLKASGTISTKADKTTTVSAGTGLTGGGDLSANRTISANFGTTAGTIAQGNDSRITGAIQSTVVDAKGDLLVASAADTVTRIGVGNNGETLVADSAQATGVKWGTAPQQSSLYPISAYGFFTAPADFTFFTRNDTFISAYYVRVFVPAGKAINAIGTCVYVAGTVGAGGLNGYAIYTDAGVLVTSTPNDDNLFTATGWAIKVLASPIAAQTSDRFVYCALSSKGYSSSPQVPYVVGSPAYLNGGGYGVTGGRRSFYTFDSSWPASFNPTTYGDSTSGYMPLVALG